MDAGEQAVGAGTEEVGLNLQFPVVETNGELTSTRRSLTIAVEGCCHGELDTIYHILQEKKKRGHHVDLLLICGDFQSIRTESDLFSMAVPPKYRRMNSFQDYFIGKKVAPVPTLFIGGNHEASNVLQSLCYGGYVAPNIYFMGFSGIVNFAGVRIAGLSGIFNDRHYRLGRYENPPYTEDSIRSIYHLRELDVYRMNHVKMPVNIFLSHDWPQGIWNYGDAQGLLKIKPYFREDMQSGKLGSPPLMQLLRVMKPTHWFAAHLHVKFNATYFHQDDSTLDKSCENSSSAKRRLLDKATTFLALDKVIRGREFLHIFEVPRDMSIPGADTFAFQFDTEWLAILKKTHQLMQTCKRTVYMPSTLLDITKDDLQEAETLIRSFNDGSMTIPRIDPQRLDSPVCSPISPSNEQTDFLLSALRLHHIWTKPHIVEVAGEEIVDDKNGIKDLAIDENEICLDDV